MPINGGAINQYPINGGAAPLEADVGILSLGGYSFCGDQIGFNSPNLWSSGEIRLNTFNNSLSNGGVLVNQLLREKNVTMTVVLGSDTKLGLQQKIDDLKSAVYVRETELLNYWAGEVRALKVTTTGVIEVNYRSDYSAEVTFSLFANDPANWYAKDAITVSNLGVTTDFTFTVNNEGNLTSNGKFYFVFNTGTTATGFTITIGGYDIIITTSLTTGDVIMLDTQEAKITKNGTIIGVRGPLTVGLEKGNNPIQVDFDGTVNCDVSVVYYKNYL